MSKASILKASAAIGIVAFFASASWSAPGPLPAGAAAYNSILASNQRVSTDYKIGPLDVIAVTVFQEPDLTQKDMVVDASGNILLPLIGTVPAGGKTATELGKQIAVLLSEKYLDNPQVSVLVQQSASQRVTVEGSVTKPGVYQIAGPTTLSDALAMASGPTRVAALSQVVVFRVIDGQQQGGVFDLSKIRRGSMPDPEIQGGDRIVVGLSHVKAAWRDLLGTASFLSVVRPY
jgi:polysaccharide export outer membrane protein